MLKLKDAIRRARQRRNTTSGSADDIKAYLGEAAEKRAEELFEVLADELRTVAQIELKKVTSGIKKGDPGEKGRSIVGAPGPRGASIRGPRGKQGKPGRPGIVKKGDEGKPGKDGREITKKELQALINTIKEGIQMSSIKGLTSLLRNMQRAMRESSGGRMIHGGGMTLVAGANVTLVRNSNGTWTVASTSSGGSNILTETVVAVQSGNDVTIDLTQLAHTANGILITAKNGQILIGNGNSNIAGSSWSQTGSVITVYNADASETFQIQYTYA